MTERDKSSTLAAVLGIVLGILGTVLFFTVIGKPARMSGNYNNWRKLNLVLQEIQKCYVDTCNIAGVKFPQDSMVRRMKGRAGTEVGILVKRGEEKIPFNIKRGKIPMHCVDAAFMINDTTGYIRLSKFSRTTFVEVSAAAEKLLDNNMKHLVFDLRDNSGGYLDQALLLSVMFLEKGEELGYLQGLHQKRADYKAAGTGFLK